MKTLMNIDNIKEHVSNLRDKNTDRKRANHVNRLIARWEEVQSQPDVVSVTINVDWKPSATWGLNPTATGQFTYADGTHAVYTAKASGCGYDKHSTVVAEVMTKGAQGHLDRILANPRNKNKEVPYGIHVSQGIFPSGFSGGVGMNCYRDIGEFLNGTFKDVVSGKTYDVHVFVANPKRKSRAKKQAE